MYRHVRCPDAVVPGRYTQCMAPRHRTLIVVLLIVTGVASHAEAQAEAGHELEGYASWYAGKFQGRTTASGEVFNTNELTAAHKTLPFGTVVEVTHLANGRTVSVRINDRGPFVTGRVIDLSRAAAEEIAMTGEGVARVRLRVVAEPEPVARRIQIASFSSRTNAERKRDMLRSHGLATEIEQVGELYRVVIPGVSEDQVDAILERLSGLGYRNVLVRSE